MLHVNEPELTLIGGREVMAFNARGETILVDVRCERVGPPPGAVSSPSSARFVVTVRPPSLEAGASAPHILIRQEGRSLWDALLDARAGLEEAGWLLPIAAARRGWWCTYADRRPDVTVVHPLGDLSQSEGMLQTIPQQEVVTVSEQREAHQRWVQIDTARQDSP